MSHFKNLHKLSLSKSSEEEFFYWSARVNFVKLIFYSHKKRWPLDIRDSTNRLREPTTNLEQA